ncbi:zinc-dependent peptidase [Pseudomonas typographi]|uniref:Zinc-dependent peptidase n=1 Tax=Pseudomonas typographi TaxID=2715964 RepID=A0ABR7Z507_9PSED|nr:M90 family metallopeptidase [Pseudomonas typographi]MBD1590208.1 zinc-dependent peptidase [Pseudomonas typographi]MBD1600553.1 zinc-dependent peptidase [Pseudomonas typographi]
MWPFSAWRRRRALARYAISDMLWAQARERLPILDGLTAEQYTRLRERAALFLNDKTLTTLPGVDLDDAGRVHLAALAQLPLLQLGELNWYQGFHEIVLYPDDFVSPQRYRDAAGIEHEGNAEHSGEAWQQGPVIMAWSGVLASGKWEDYNLVVHELAHKLDMLNGSANGLPPLHAGMHVEDWAEAMQHAFDDLNHRLDAHPHAKTPMDPYAAENPAEFFAVTSEYFFSAPDLLERAYPKVYAQLRLFYRQDPLARLRQLNTASAATHPQH